MTVTDTTIRPIEAAEAEARIGELADILLACVVDGASVNFMAGLSHADAVTFWRSQMPDIASLDKRLFVADDGGTLVGTVLLALAPQPNAPHRAEIGKMLIHPSRRRQGLGRRLLTTAEDAARGLGRTLLMLDTESGSAGDLLYRRCGWKEVGRVPGHAFRPNGQLAETTIFFKTLGHQR
jgi:GNAT superfamily N-acetyltransferase